MQRRAAQWTVLACLAVGPSSWADEVGTPVAALMLLQSVAQRQALPPEPQAFELDDQSPTHDFGQGPQPYVLIELPPYREPYEVRLWSEPKAKGYQSVDQHTRIVPRIFTLKSDFSVARSYSGSQLRDRNGSPEKTVFMNPKNQDVSALRNYIVSNSEVKFHPVGFQVSGVGKNRLDSGELIKPVADDV